MEACRDSKGTSTIRDTSWEGWRRVWVAGGGDWGGAPPDVATSTRVCAGGGMMLQDMVTLTAIFRFLVKSV